MADLDVAAGPVPEAAAALLDEVGGRDVVAFGGGRVVDAAKAVTAVGGGRVAAIPTTLAGSTFTPFHRMPDGPPGLRLAGRPALAVCDPALMASAPRETLTATAMNALAHGIEALYGPLANPMTEGAVAARRPADPGRAGVRPARRGRPGPGRPARRLVRGRRGGPGRAPRLLPDPGRGAADPARAHQRGDAAALDRLHGRSCPGPAGPAGGRAGRARRGRRVRAGGAGGRRGGSHDAGRRWAWPPATWTGSWTP